MRQLPRLPTIAIYRHFKRDLLPRLSGPLEPNISITKPQTTALQKRNGNLRMMVVAKPIILEEIFPVTG